MSSGKHHGREGGRQRGRASELQGCGEEDSKETSTARRSPAGRVRPARGRAASPRRERPRAAASATTAQADSRDRETGRLVEHMRRGTPDADQVSSAGIATHSNNARDAQSAHSHAPLNAETQTEGVAATKRHPTSELNRKGTCLRAMARRSSAWNTSYFI